MPNSFAFSTLNLPGLSFSSNKYENAVIEWFAFAAWIKNFLSSKISENPENVLKRFVSIIPKGKKIAIMYKKELDPKMKLKGLKKYHIYRHKSLTRTILIKWN